jgi:hypothetical protein
LGSILKSRRDGRDHPNRHTNQLLNDARYDIPSLIEGLNKYITQDFPREGERLENIFKCIHDPDSEWDYNDDPVMSKIKKLSLMINILTYRSNDVHDLPNSLNGLEQIWNEGPKPQYVDPNLKEHERREENIGFAITAAAMSQSYF